MSANLLSIFLLISVIIIDKKTLFFSFFVMDRESIEFNLRVLL